MKRMNRDKFQIGVYNLAPYARSDKHIREIAECGLDYVICMDNNDRETLDLFQKYGVGAIVTSVVPPWAGADGRNAGKMSQMNPLEKYQEAIENFTDHPAVWGIEVGDEPSSLDFDHYGKIINMVDCNVSKQFAYVPMYPNYGLWGASDAKEAAKQLGTNTFEEYIEQYCQKIPSDFLCYDFYVYSSDVPKMYESLRVVSEACRKTGRSMWIVLQVNSSIENIWLTQDNLRFQANTALAFGVDSIIWACYTAGWWYNQVLDREGNKTEQYDKLKLMNSELHAISQEYMKYRNVSTHFVGFKDTKWLDGVKQKALVELNTGIFYHLQEEQGSPLVVGQMVSKENRNQALFICAADDPYDEHKKEICVRFEAPGRKLQAFCGQEEVSLEQGNDGVYTLKMKSNMGVLVTERIEL